MGETGVAMATLVGVQVCSYLKILYPQAMSQVISLHTFMGLFWSIGIQGRAARLSALGIVTCIWLFVILFCGLGAGIHNTSGDLYEVSLPHLFLETVDLRRTIRLRRHTGAGYPGNSRRNVSLGSTSGSGLRCSSL